MRGTRLLGRLVRRVAANRQKPNPLFDAEWYLSRNPDVRSGRHDPYVHYVRHGQFEGRDPNAYFDTDWYLRRYSDVLRGRPLDDYLRVGAGQGRDPSPLFWSSWYLDQNPDVRASGLNPLLHFLRHGEREGRLPRPPDAARELDAVPAPPRPLPSAARSSPAVSIVRQRSRPVRGTVVVIDEKVPEHDQHAGGLAVWQYLKLLVEEDFAVVYVAHDGVLSEPYASDMEQLGIALLAGPAEAIAWLKSNGQGVDVVICARPAVAPLYLGQVRALTRARLLYFTVDLHFVREQRHYEIDGRPEILELSKELRRAECRIIDAVDAVLTPSTEEARVIGEIAPGTEVHVIPLLAYGPDDLDRRGPPLADRRKVVFVGGFRHQPNVDAVVFLVREVMPLVWHAAPDTGLVIVGSHPTNEVLELESQRVEVTGYVPDLVPYYDQARMSVSPIRFGAGVKGKIIGSLAAGVPVVTTSIGNEGLDLVHGRDALIADDPAGLAAAIVSLIQDTELAGALAERGSVLVAERFSVAAVRDALLGAMEPAIPSRPV